MSFPCIMQIPCMGVGHNKKPFHSCPKERVYGQLDRHIYDGVLCLASVVLCCLSNRKNVGSELPWWLWEHNYALGSFIVLVDVSLCPCKVFFIIPGHLNCALSPVL